MNRRQFAMITGLGLAGLGLNRSGREAASSAPQIAITMDDFSWRNAVHLTAEKRNRAILEVLTPIAPERRCL